MNRFKYRIWDNAMKLWLCEDSQYLQMDGKKVHAAPWSTIEWNIPSDRYIIQQYTGLQDRDGKDIYEGDIVEYTYNVGCFRFSNGKLLRGCIPSNEIIQEKINQQVKWQGAQFIGIHPIIKIGYTLVDKKPQVIGNIFENPELIKINDHNNQTDS